MEQSLGVKEAAKQNYADFQQTIYIGGALHGQRPTVTTDPNELTAQARATMTRRAYDYIAGAAGERLTLEANRLAFREWSLVPRMLRDTSERDTRVELFGETYPSPVLLAPVGVQEIYHEDAETGVAGVAAQLGVPYIMSTASSRSIEQVARASGDTGKRWFQLYWPATEDITASLLKRARDSGFTALVVTLDTFTLAWRPSDLNNAYLPFVKGIGCQVGLSDPAFQKSFREQTGKSVEDDVVHASLLWQKDVFNGKAHTWEDIALLKKHWDGPIILKGIQSVADARLARDAGVQGIVVSNHGGRQVDGAVGSLSVLPDIADAVGEDLTVLFDSGIRSGVDIIKALSLGAKAVFLGRPWVYGLGINGKEGAKQVIQGILADFDQSMCLSGYKSISELQRDILQRRNYQWGPINAL